MKTFKLLPAGSVRSTTYTQNLDRSNDAIGVEAVLDVTVAPGIDTVTLAINWRDSVSGKSGVLIAAAARVAVGTDRIRVFPGIAVAANLSASDVVPDEFNVTVTHSAGTNFTYSLKVQDLLAR